MQNLTNVSIEHLCGLIPCNLYVQPLFCYEHFPVIFVHFIDYRVLDFVLCIPTQVLKILCLIFAPRSKENIWLICSPSSVV